MIRATSTMPGSSRRNDFFWPCEDLLVVARDGGRAARLPAVGGGAGAAGCSAGTWAGGSSHATGGDGRSVSSSEGVTSIGPEGREPSSVVIVGVPPSRAAQRRAARAPRSCAAPRHRAYGYAGSAVVDLALRRSGGTGARSAQRPVTGSRRSLILAALPRRSRR